MEFDNTERDLDNWIRRHGVLDSLDSLEALARENPITLRQVIRIALMLGIHAGHKQQALGVVSASIERDIADAVRRHSVGLSVIR